MSMRCLNKSVSFSVDISEIDPNWQSRLQIRGDIKDNSKIIFLISQWKHML